MTKSLLGVLFLKSSVHIIDHLFKVPKLPYLLQQVAYEDLKELTGAGHHVWIARHKKGEWIVLLLAL